MSSPKRTLSKMIHGENLKNWPQESIEQMNDRIMEHVLKCKHPKCKRTREGLGYRD